MTAGTAILAVELTIYTDAMVIRGRVQVPDRSLAETLAALPGGVLELDDVMLEEHGSRGRPVTAPVAFVRTEAIVLVLSEPLLPADPAQGRPSVLLAMPPFGVAGRLSVLSPDDGLRDALRALPRVGFLTVSDAAYWSEPLGEGRRRSSAITVNAARIQAALPYREVDPWAGLDQPRTAEAGLGFEAGRPVDAGRAGDRGMTAGGEGQTPA
jgi:hypothetical protein